MTPAGPPPPPRPQRRWAVYILALVFVAAALFLLGLRAWEVWVLILVIVYAAWVLRSA